MDKKSNRLLRVILYITSGIILMLFLAFILTYDLTDSSKYQNNNGYDITEKVENSLKSSSSLNYMRIEFSDEELENFITYLVRKKGYGDESNLYVGKYWTLKGINIDIINDKIYFDLHTSYHRYINYELNIKMVFTLIEEDEYINLTFNSISFGALMIPSESLSKTLSEKDNATIGYIIDVLFKSLDMEINIGDENYIKINKDILLKNADYIFLDDSNYTDTQKIIFKLYLNELLKTNKKFITLNNKLILLFNYNKLVSSVDEDELNSKDVVNDVSNIVLKAFVSSNITYNEFYDYISYSFNNLIDDKKLLNVSYVDSYVYNNLLYINLYVKFYNNFSTISYEFDFENNKLLLRNVYIGFDDNEELYLGDSNSYFKLISDYLYVDKGYVNILNACEFDNQVLINPLYASEIEDALLDDGYYNSLNEELKISHNTISEVLNNYLELSEELRLEFLTSLKQYFKENDKVYNYIVSVMR